MSSKKFLTEIDRPNNIDKDVRYGSDVAAQMLRRLGIDYIALNPGASYRGLHDSLVNHLGNHQPEMLMCLHEEHAVAIAQGYAKAGGEPMAVALHSNVGLMHGTMAIFNAWCDRQPMLIMGATGPVDSALRRPWIDWLHTAQDQGALIRNFVKYDDQPGSADAIPESMMRAWQQAATSPKGPTYVCLDAAIQENELEGEFEFPDVERFMPAPPVGPSRESLSQLTALIQDAVQPVFLIGKCNFDDQDWVNRISLVEQTNGKMLTDLKTHSVVPTNHPRHVGEPFNKLGKSGREAIQRADLIVSLGWVDLGGVLRQALGANPVTAKVVHVNQDMHLHNGWGRETFQLPPTDLLIVADPDETVRELIGELGIHPKLGENLESVPEFPEFIGHLNLVDVARELLTAVGSQKVSFASLARAWPTKYWPFSDPLSYLGKDGGGGVGSGPGLCVGAALKLKDSDRLVVGVIGDGDCMMGVNAFWTAARYTIPVLIIVANNRSYYNDELHQEGVAIHRGRDPENRWVGQTIDHPAPNISQIADGLGIESAGPITSIEGLKAALTHGVEVVRGGKPFLVDVHIDPRHGRELTESMAERSLAQKG